MQEDNKWENYYRSLLSQKRIKKTNHKSEFVRKPRARQTIYIECTQKCNQKVK